MRPTTTATRSGRRRSQAASDSILAATRELLLEQGYASLTMAAVIERAGVSSATLYRWWDRKQDLVADALAEFSPEHADLDTGSLRGDLHALLHEIACAVQRRPEGLADAVTLEARHDPVLADAFRERFLDPRLVQVRGVLDRAQQRGEVVAVPSAEMALSLVAGSVYHRGIILREPVTPSFVRMAADFAYRGLTASSAGE